MLHVSAVLTIFELKIKWTYIYMHIILCFKYHVFTAWRQSVLPEHVACVEGSDRICCGWQRYVCTFLGASARLQKATHSFVMSVRPHELTHSHGTGFHEMWYLSILQKKVEKIQVSLKSEQYNRHCTWKLMYIFNHISALFFLESYAENQNTFCL